MYDYLTPDGYGDTFFIYNVNGEDIPIVNGESYSLLGVPVQDGMFVCRVWSGAVLLIDGNGTVQMYDGVRNAWFQLPIFLNGIFPPSMAVLPEKVYRDNTALRFDLTSTSLKVNSNGGASVYADQMAWYGVKRNPGTVSDPLKSQYKYYEKPFSYPIQVTLDDYGPSDGGGNPISGLAAPTQYTILIQDFDFELRRITVGQQVGIGTVTFAVEGSGTINVSGVAGTEIGLFTDNIGTPNQPMTVMVSGNQIKVEDSTDNTGSGSGTAAQAVSAINSNSAAAALVTATLVIPGSYPESDAFFVIPGGGAGGLLSYDSPFKIMLYDATWRQRMTVPILCELLCHSASTTAPPTPTPMPNNAWPSPPLLYPVNSVIRFDIFSLIPTGDALPINIMLTFEGVRRITC